MNTTYHGKKEYFELEYNDSPDTRVCFFIHKRLDPKSWTVTHHSPDAATVHLKVWRDEKESIINIHNFYNEPTPEGSGDFYAITQKLGETMDNIEKALRLEGEHILTGDFNLHHQAWAGHGETRHHNTAKILMELVNGAEMALTLPVGTITRERRAQSINAGPNLHIPIATTERRTPDMRKRREIGSPIRSLSDSYDLRP